MKAMEVFKELIHLSADIHKKVYQLYFKYADEKELIPIDTDFSMYEKDSFKAIVMSRRIKNTNYPGDDIYNFGIFINDAIVKISNIIRYNGIKWNTDILINDGDKLHEISKIETIYSDKLDRNLIVVII